MAWNTHTDVKNRAYSSILTTLFPEQTKTLPRIIVWSIIFLVDLVLVVFGAFHFGLLHLGNYSSMRQMTLPGLLLLTVLFAIFWLQGFIWYGMIKLLKKRNEFG